MYLFVLHTGSPECGHKSKIRELQAARNLSLLYTIIMNVYRSFGFYSIKQGIYWLGNNWDKNLAFST